MVLTGGIGTLIGPILGAMVFILIQEVLSSYTEHWMIFTGAVFVLMVIRSDGAHRRHRHAHRPDPRRDGLHPHPGSALQLHRALDDLHRRRVRPDGDQIGWCSPAASARSSARSSARWSSSSSRKCSPATPSTG